MKAVRVDFLFNVYGDFERAFGEGAWNGDTYTYRNSEIELVSRTTRQEGGIFSRADKIKNISSRSIEITCALSRFALNGGEYEVYTQTNQHIREGQGEWQPLVTGVFGSSDEIRTNQDVNPFVAVYNQQNSRGIAYHLMCSSMFEYRVSRHCEFLDDKVVLVELGIKGDNFSYTLAPNEELCLPEIIYYEFKSKTDLDAYKLHRYFNSLGEARLPIIYNSWMSNFDLIEFDDLMRQLEGAVELGCEYFTVDAGWFGITQKWWDVVGDWQESTQSSMKGRLKEFSDRVREAGLKFGLWFEIERASLESENLRAHPEYYIIDGAHAYVDFSKREACDFIYGILKNNIEKYGVEFIKFDLNAPLRFDKTRHAFIDYYEGYKYFLSLIRRDYPDLHLECCASGGGRMSLSNVPYFDSFWMSDNHGIYPQLEIFKNTIKRMPSSRLERWATVRSVEDFTPTYPVGGKEERILLSSHSNWQRVEEASIEFIKNALVGGPIGISCDLTQVSEGTKRELAELIAEYKGERAFWQDSECHILCDTKTMLALQFNDKYYNEIKIYIYTKHPNQEYVTVYPFFDKVEERTYTVVSGDEMCEMSERGLDENGITFRANLQNQSKKAVLKIKR